MSTQYVTRAEARDIHVTTAQAVAEMRAEADAIEAAGAPEDVVAEGYGMTITRAEAVATKRRIADSRERAGMRVQAGMRVRKA